VAITAPPSSFKLLVIIVKLPPVPVLTVSVNTLVPSPLKFTDSVALIARIPPIPVPRLIEKTKLLTAPFRLAWERLTISPGFEPNCKPIGTLTVNRGEL
jgi:hypothetical protein